MQGRGFKSAKKWNNCLEKLKICKKKLLDLPPAAADQMLEHLSSKCKVSGSNLPKMEQNFQDL
jgi:hypothetical protein